MSYFKYVVGKFEANAPPLIDKEYRHSPLSLSETFRIMNYFFDGHPETIGDMTLEVYLESIGVIVINLTDYIVVDEEKYALWLLTR